MHAEKKFLLCRVGTLPSWFRACQVGSKDA